MPTKPERLRFVCLSRPCARAGTPAVLCSCSHRNTGVQVQTCAKHNLLLKAVCVSKEHQPCCHHADVAVLQVEPCEPEDKSSGEQQPESVEPPPHACNPQIRPSGVEATIPPCCPQLTLGAPTVMASIAAASLPGPAWKVPASPEMYWTDILDGVPAAGVEEESLDLLVSLGQGTDSHKHACLPHA